MLAECLHSAGNRVAGCLVAGLDQELAVGNELRLGQRHAAEFALHQFGDQIVPRVFATLLDHLLEVGVQFTASTHGGLLSVLARALVFRIVLADDFVGPPEELLPIGLRGTEDPGDHGDGKRCREGVDEVTFAGRALGRCLIDDAAGDAIDLLTPGVPPSG